MIVAYIAHTSACTDWPLDDMLKGSMFRKSARTWRVPPEKVEMLDWDFRRVKVRGFEKTWDRHLGLAQEHDFDVVMAPDLFSMCEYRERIRQYEELKNYAQRVVLPVHVCPDNNGLELAWPMGVWTRDYVFVWDVYREVTHLLGGSPHAQLRMADYFPNLKTIDGNQTFWCAVHFGRVWRDRWVTPEPRLTNDVCFHETIQNVTKAWRAED